MPDSRPNPYDRSGRRNPAVPKSLPRMFEGFDSKEVRTSETTIFIRRSGDGPPVLLLHGFPQTHVMWREVAPLLARPFTVICADLRGYGQSGCPASRSDHAAYSKRAMATELVEVMEQLGFQRFAVAGHDRGGRVAYRLALDHPDCVRKLAVLDIVPTAAAWNRANADFALGFWPWSLLAQDEPLPERILTATAAAIVDSALDNWGSSGETFPPEIRAIYSDMLRDPQHAHAICEEYRAAAAIDRDHDETDRKDGKRIACPLLVLWSNKGPLNTWYQKEGGPIGLWHAWADHVSGEAMAGGHFFPEELPQQTADRLKRFLVE
jgi:haloacetate dehalogenase